MFIPVTMMTITDEALTDGETPPTPKTHTYKHLRADNCRLDLVATTALVYYFRRQTRHACTLNIKQVL